MCDTVSLFCVAAVVISNAHTAAGVAATEKGEEAKNAIHSFFCLPPPPFSHALPRKLGLVCELERSKEATTESCSHVHRETAQRG